MDFIRDSLKTKNTAVLAACAVASIIAAGAVAYVVKLRNAKKATRLAQDNAIPKITAEKAAVKKITAEKAAVKKVTAEKSALSVLQWPSA